MNVPHVVTLHRISDMKTDGKIHIKHQFAQTLRPGHYCYRQWDESLRDAQVLKEIRIRADGVTLIFENGKVAEAGREDSYTVRVFPDDVMEILQEYQDGGLERDSLENLHTMLALDYKTIDHVRVAYNRERLRSMGVNQLQSEVLCTEVASLLRDLKNRNAHSLSFVESLMNSPESSSEDS